MHVSLRTLWGPALAIAVMAGCSSPDRSAELQALLDEGEYEEVLARIEVYREDGERSPSLQYYAGMAHLGENADKIAFKELRKAIEAEPKYVPSTVEALRAAALTDYEGSWIDRGRLRMREAYRYDSAVDLGPLADPVADVFYRNEKDYQKAYDVYRELVRSTRGTEEKQREWLFRYGHCLEQLGFLEDALSVYRDYIHRWPTDTKFMRNVQWRWQKNLQDLAQAARDQGQPAEAMEFLQEALSSEWHRDLQQLGRYMAGQIQEEQGNFEDALHWYEAILDDGDRFGGDVVKQAKDRIDAIHELGVH